MLGRQIAIGFGVAIIFPMLIYYGVCTFSPPPNLQDFSQTASRPGTTPDHHAEQANKNKAASTSYEEASRVFSLRLLCVAAPLGYAAILLGSLRMSSGLGTGLMFGGIFAVIDGYLFSWSFLENWLPFVSLLVALAVLIFVSYRQFWPAGRAGRTSGP
jgi:lipopolysaccharide export LptBFGC system permease protein LptF